MTKKHFVQLANVMRLEVKPQMDEYVNHAFSCTSNTLVPALFSNVCNELADFCQSQNTQFDRERFLAACGVAR